VASSARARRTSRKISRAGASLLCAAFAAAPAARRPRSRRRGAPVATARVVARDLEERIGAAASSGAAHTTLAAEVSGRITKVVLEEGATRSSPAPSSSRSTPSAGSVDERARAPRRRRRASRRAPRHAARADAHQQSVASESQLDRPRPRCSLPRRTAPPAGEPARPRDAGHRAVRRRAGRQRRRVRAAGHAAVRAGRARSDRGRVPRLRGRLEPRRVGQAVGVRVAPFPDELFLVTSAGR
jgi:hypothetical protein